jgi:ABC-type bacteriocin/lantibiotic exporter with double-glycine peptidase domain
MGQVAERVVGLRRRVVAWTVAGLTAGACATAVAAPSQASSATVARLVSAVTGVEVLGEVSIRQRRRNDCGAAALAMVLEAFGCGASLDVLERDTRMGPRGVSMLALLDSAERRGLDGTGWRLTWPELERVAYPAIAFVDGNHFVVVLGASSSRVELADPARGRLRLTRRAFERRWRGELLTFRPLRETGE